MSAKPYLSIVIPLHRTEFLDKQLYCMSAMTGMDRNIELIYVQNPEITEDAAETVHKWSEHLNVQLLECEPGANRARNVGIEAAQSDKIAMTDDDCLPEQQWLAKCLSIFTLHPNIGVFGGPLHINFLCEKPRWLEGYLLDLTGRLDHGGEIVDYSHFGYEADAALVTANLALPKRSWEAAGGFEEHLGQRQGLNPGGTNEIDEILFINRCTDPRHRPQKFYIGSMVMWHQIDRNRISMEYLLKKAYTHGAGCATMMLNSPRLENHTIEDIIHDFLVTQWISVVSHYDISMTRQQVAHEESLRIYIRNAIKCRTEFMRGFNEVMDNSGRRSYTEETNPLYFIGPKFLDQYK